jgi:APA family basic amino acid/polyamine antiporter
MGANVTKQLDRSLGLGSVFSIAVGAMLGSGIFVLPGLAAAIAGPWVALSFLVAGLLVIPAVLSQTELATAMPVAGGTYVYVDRSMGSWLGIITGLGTWFSLSAKTAFALVGLGGYLVYFTDAPPKMVSLSILVVMVALNLIGASKASMIQKIIVAGCLVFLLYFVGAGILTLDPALLSPAFPTGTEGIMGGAAFVYVGYAGVTKICSVAEEIQNPERNIPLAVFLAQAVVTVLYFLVAWVMAGNVDYEVLSTDIAPIASSAMAIGGPNMRLVFCVVAIAALVSMCNADVMAIARFPFAMSRDRILPAFLHRINPRFGSPAAAIMVTGVILFLLVTVLPVVTLAKLASGFLIFIFSVINVAVIVLRESGARWYRPTFKSPLYPWTQIVGILGGVWLLYALGLKPIIGVVAVVLVGTAWYFGYARSRVDRKSVVRHLWGEAKALEATIQAEAEECSWGKDQEPPRVVVPVFGSEPAPSRLVRLAASFVEEGRLEVLRLEEVSDSASLASFLATDDRTRTLAERAAQIGEEAHLQVDFHDVVTHNAKAALKHHAESTKAEWIVMEWPTRHDLRFLVRHPLAWWIDHPPCDLAIFLDRAGPFDGDTSDDFERILVLAEPGPYDSLLVHVADKLASSQKDALITLFEPVDVDTSEAVMQQHAAYHEQLGSMCASPCRSLIVRGENPYKTIADVGKDYDILILGAPPERPFKNLFVRSREDKAAAMAPCSVLKVKAPRHQVHHRFELRREDTQERMILTPYIHHAVVGTKVNIQRKQELFRYVADRIVALGLCETAAPIITALQERELRQNTALREGVAISAPMVEGLKCTEVVIVTLERAIDYQSSGRPMVDVILLVLAPRSDRQMQLWVLERLARMALRSPMLERLREAKDEDGIRAVVHAIIKEEQI